MNRFRFIDVPTSAEMVGITRNELLRLVEQGRIRPFSGKGQQSVFRTADVERLAEELRQEGVAAQAAADAEAAEAEATASNEVPPGQSPQAEAKRVRRRDSIKLMGTRLSMDSRWAEMTDRDIATWLDALEPVQFERVRKVATIAIERLSRVLGMMDAFERGNPDRFANLPKTPHSGEGEEKPPPLTP